MPKIKIISVPSSNKKEFGGQSKFLSLDIGNNTIPGGYLGAPNPFNFSNTLQGVPKGQGNAELEKKEQIVGDFNHDGKPELLGVNGPAHTQGGIDVNLPNGAYVYSDTKKMKIGGPILSMFGKPEDTKKKYTPADLAKQYDINKFKAIVDNPDSDKLQVTTAQRQIDEYTAKLQQLAVLSEAKKGFPTGMPQVGPQPQQGGQEGQQMTGKYGGKYQDGGINGSAPRPSSMMFLPNQPQNNIQVSGPSSGQFNNWNNGADPYVTTPYNNNEWSWNGIAPVKPDAVPWGQFSPQPGFPDTFPAPVTSSSNDKNTDIPQGTLDPNYAKFNPRYGISNADRLSQVAALYAQANIKRPGNYVAPAKFTSPQVSFVSPEREIAANAEQANSQSMFNAYTSDGSRQRAVNSSIQGEALGNLGNILSRNQGQNTELANKQSEMYANTQNKQAEFNANRLNELFKQGEIGEQQYRNALSAGFSNIAKTNQQVDRNAAETSWINAIHSKSPYQIDPKTGATFYNKDFVPSLNGNSSGADNDIYATIKSRADQIVASSKGAVTPEDAYKMAHGEEMAKRNRYTNAPFNMKANRSTSTYNPAFSDNQYQGGNGYNYGPGQGY